MTWDNSQVSNLSKSSVNNSAIYWSKNMKSREGLCNKDCEFGFEMLMRY